MKGEAERRKGCKEGREGGGRKRREEEWKPSMKGKKGGRNVRMIGRETGKERKEGISSAPYQLFTRKFNEKASMKAEVAPVPVTIC